MSFNPPQPEVWNFPQVDWENIPEIIKSYFLKANQQQNRILDWLGKHQFPEKIKTGFKNQEKQTQVFEEFKASSGRDFEFYKERVQQTHARFEKMFESASEECRTLEQMASLGSFATRPATQQAPDFLEDQRLFLESHPVASQPPEAERDRVADARRENQFAVWTIVNAFTHESSLRRRIDQMQTSMKQIEAKVLQNQESVLSLVHANTQRINSVDQNLTQQLVAHRLDIDKLIGLDFHGLQLNIQKSMEELQNLKNASVVVQKLDDKYLRKFAEV